MFILDRPDQRKQIIDTKVKLLVDTFIKNQNFKGDILEKLVLALGSEQTSAPIVVVDTLLVPSPTTRITTSSPKITLFRARNLAVVAVDRLPADVPVWFSLFKQQWGNSLTLYLFITMCFYCDHCGFFFSSTATNARRKTADHSPIRDGKNFTNCYFFHPGRPKTNECSLKGISR